MDDELLSVHLLAMQQLVPAVSFSPAGSLMQALREIKAPDELAAMRKAAELIDSVYMETLTQLREGVTELDISDFVLLKHNPKIKDYDVSKPGEIIKVPNFYNRKVVLYIDQNNFLPLVQITYDENGVLEKYEMSSFLLNPDLKQEEFTSSYSSYGF